MKKPQRQQRRALQKCLQQAQQFFKNSAQQNPRQFRKLPCYIIFDLAPNASDELLQQAELQWQQNPPQTFKTRTGNILSQWWLSQEALFIQINNVDLTPTIVLDFIAFIYEKFHSFNGLLLNIDLAYFHDSAPKDVNDNLGYCLQNLWQQHPNLPLYGLINHYERLSGFEDFFADFNAEERAQLLVVEWPNPRDQQNLITQFEQQFNILLQHLNTQLLWRMQQQPQLDKRQKIAEFSLQQEALGQHIKSWLQPLSYCQGMDFRGLYFFASSDAKPILDFLPSLTAATTANNINSITVTITPTHQSYFSPRILQHILQQLPAQKSNQRIPAWIKSTSYASIAVAALTFSAFNYYSYTDQRYALQKVTQLLQHKPALITATPSLEKISQALQLLQQQQKQQRWNPILANNNIMQPLAKTLQHRYLATLKQQFIPQLQQALENQIQLAMANHAPALYQDLTVYWMLGHPQKMQIAVVEQWFQQHWQHSYHQNAQLQQQLLQHLRAALNERSTQLHLNQALFNKAKNELQKIPLQQIIFTKLLDQYQQQDITLINNKYSFIFANAPYKISAIYSKQRVSEIYQQQIPKLINQFMSEQQILAIKSDKNFSRKKLLQKVREHYLKQYAQAWQQLLKHLQLKKNVSIIASS